MNKNVIYDKFLMLEGWAYRGKILIEKEEIERCKECYVRSKQLINELEVLLKVEPA